MYAYFSPSEFPAIQKSWWQSDFCTNKHQNQGKKGDYEKE